MMEFTHVSTRNLPTPPIASPSFLFLYIITCSLLTSIFLSTHSIDSPQFLIGHTDFKLLRVQREKVSYGYVLVRGQVCIEDMRT